MTVQEISEKYHMSELSITKNFLRTQESILKKYGVKIIKEGRGEKATYREEYVTDQRAKTLYDETREKMLISNDSLKLMNWEFMVFLALIMTPMLVFRGSFEDFLKYVEVPVTDANITQLKGALSNLEKQNYISYNLDRTDNKYFVAAIYRKVEEEMQIGIGMIQDCKRLAKKHHKRSWVPILKTWLGVEMLSKNQPYTVEDLKAITGLSDYQIRESNKILKESNVFKTSRAYAGYLMCIGTNVDLNVPEMYDV
jgi:hypothetical protein